MLKVVGLALADAEIRRVGHGDVRARVRPAEGGS